MQISIGSDRLWQSFADAFGIDAQDPDYTTNADRVGNRSRLTAQIESVFSAYDAPTLLEKLSEVGVPAGRVRTMEEVYEWEQLHSQGLAIEVEHALLGNITLPGPPLRFFDPATETEITKTSHTAPPMLDADSDDIRSWLEESLTGSAGRSAS